MFHRFVLSGLMPDKLSVLLATEVAHAEPPKKRQRVNAKATAKALAERAMAAKATSSVKKAEDEIKLTVQDGDEKRDAVWIDDVILCIYGPIKFVTSNALINRKDIMRRVSEALTFMFMVSNGEKYMYNGKEHTSWLKLRK